jgi:hypothetical protein
MLLRHKPLDQIFVLFIYVFKVGIPGSVVGIATGYGIED